MSWNTFTFPSYFGSYLCWRWKQTVLTRYPNGRLTGKVHFCLYLCPIMTNHCVVYACIECYVHFYSPLSFANTFFFCTWFMASTLWFCLSKMNREKNKKKFLRQNVRGSDFCYGCTVRYCYCEHLTVLCSYISCSFALTLALTFCLSFRYVYFYRFVVL